MFGYVGQLFSLNLMYSQLSHEGGGLFFSSVSFLPSGFCCFLTFDVALVALEAPVEFMFMHEGSV